MFSFKKTKLNHRGKYEKAADARNLCYLMNRECKQYFKKYYSINLNVNLNDYEST